MNGLGKAQERMLASILDEELSLPSGWSERHEAGLAIYRNNYRTALVAALRSTFERTERLVSKESFARAAAHHLILSPPSSWTLDLAGAGFDDTCAELYTKDPEVAELAWLEWAMHCAFVVRDTQTLDMAGFAEATAGFGEDDWASLRLGFVPGIASRSIRYDLKALWSSLSEEDAKAQPEITILDVPTSAVVWREGERPVFILLMEQESAALSAMINGATYGEACELLVETLGEEKAIATAGTMLSRWLSEGMITRVG